MTPANDATTRTSPSPTPAETESRLHLEAHRASRMAMCNFDTLDHWSEVLANDAGDPAWDLSNCRARGLSRLGNLTVRLLGASNQALLLIERLRATQARLDKAAK